MRRKERQHRCNINAGPSPVGAGFEERNHFSEPQAGWLLAAQQKDDNDDDDKEATEPPPMIRTLARTGEDRKCIGFLLL